MSIPTIYVTNGKQTIRINEADEARLKAQGFKRPEPAPPAKTPEGEKKS